MSEAVSVMNGAERGTSIRVRDAGLQGMITLRGDLSAAKLKSAVKAATGHAVPKARGIAFADGKGVAWMSPDELLLLVPYGEADAAVASLEAALAGTHSLAVNVSDARAFFAVEGASARDVIAKIAPVDMHPDSFGPGELRRTRMAQAAAAFWMSDAETIHVICFRSVGQYMFDLLATSAETGAVEAF